MSLQHSDLRGTVLPTVTIDDFEPKAGATADVIVVTFYLHDDHPAHDLNTFIQRGVIDTLSVEVSNSTDDTGKYLVFVEMSRDDTFPNKFQALLKDIENVSGKMSWEISTYLSDKQVFKLNDPNLYNYLILNPAKYVPKDEFKVASMKESVEDFFKDSLATQLNINGNCVTISNSRHSIIAEVADVGEYDAVVGRNFLSETAFDVSTIPYEARVLENALGNYKVYPFGKYLSVTNGSNIMLLSNTQLDYRK